MSISRFIGGSMKYRAMARIAVVLGFLGWVQTEAWAQTSDPDNTLILNPISQSTTLFGKPLKMEQSANTLPSNQGASITTFSQFLGKGTNIFEASVEAVPAPTAAPNPDAPIGSTDPSASPSPAPGIEIAKTDLYIGGTRVWAGTLSYNKGSLIYTGGVAPTQIPFPIFSYPLGPLLLQVNAGIEFEGGIEASLTPGLSYPLQDSSLTAKVEAELMASGFIEGDASLWIVRGGVGGRLNLIKGSTGINAFLFMNGSKPQGTYLGGVTFLSGSIYGFVDVRLFKWNRIINKNFYSWSGWCFAFDKTTCGTN